MDIKNKRIMVTGGSGFLGKFLVQRLKKEGCDQLFIPRSAQYDLRRQDAVEQVFRDSKPEIVIHLAAVVGGIGANRERPGEFFYDNLMMSTQLMETARLHNVEKFVGISTICSYPKFAPIPFREEDIWNGYPEETNAPYGLAKKMMLVQGQAYREQYNFNAIHLIPVNLYGPEDNFDPGSSHVIPALIKKCFDAIENGERELIVWGDGSPTREFLHVTEAAEAIVLATKLYDKPDPVNIGSSFEIGIRELVEVITQETGFNGKIVWDVTKPNGQPRRKLDVSRAEKEFGFRSEMDFRSGVREVIDWYRAERGLIQA
ncbi:MAG: GDP-L-fucose synthase [Candidatus Promineifilaceae bacterium]|nr:GDP-L-fucose synthase [Anaerolineaceae bacterium]